MNQWQFQGNSRPGNLMEYFLYSNFLTALFNDFMHQLRQAWWSIRSRFRQKSHMAESTKEKKKEKMKEKKQRERTNEKK